MHHDDAYTSEGDCVASDQTSELLRTFTGHLEKQTPDHPEPPLPLIAPRPTPDPDACKLPCVAIITNPNPDGNVIALNDD